MTIKGIIFEFDKANLVIDSLEEMPFNELIEVFKNL